MTVASKAGSFINGLTSAAGAAATTAQSVATGSAASLQTDSFLSQMQALTQESNKVQLAMGYMNLQKTLVEGFAKFIKEMGKGFNMQ